MSTTEIVPANSHLPALPVDLTALCTVEHVRSLIRQQEAVRHAVFEYLEEGSDYGKIPGTGDKPTLLQPGAQKILNLFQCRPEYQSAPRELPGNHVEYVQTCQLVHVASGSVLSTGVGSCTTLEKKYRYRNSGRLCPECGKEAILKSKPPKTGFYCFSKKGGCGANFPANEARILAQETGQCDNEDIADLRNTVLKMACKRAFVAAALNVSGMSTFFTQDMDDLAKEAEQYHEAQQGAKQAEVKAQAARGDEQVAAMQAEFNRALDRVKASGGDVDVATVNLKADWRRIALAAECALNPKSHTPEQFAKVIGEFRECIEGEYFGKDIPYADITTPAPEGVTPLNAEGEQALKAATRPKGKHMDEKINAEVGALSPEQVKVYAEASSAALAEGRDKADAHDIGLAAAKATTKAAA